MNIRRLTLACALVFPAATAAAQAAPPATKTPVAPVGENATAAATQRDAEALALGLLAVVNENEIAAARQAEAKGVSGAHRQFAELMIQAHGENLAKTRRLGTLGRGAEVDALRQKGQQELAALARKGPGEYPAAYAQAMVEGHQQALSLIDSRLNGLARSAAVKSHLADTRAHVVQHLAKAKALAGTDAARTMPER